jgi:hypothetical protein
MSNIDSRTPPETHNRFKTGALLIRLLLKSTSARTLSAAC